MIIHPVYKKFLLPTLAWLLACGTILSAEEMQPGNKDLIDAAVPDKAPAKPKKHRRILVTNLAMRDGKPWRGPSYWGIPENNYAFDQMGKRTGAYEAVFNDDVEMFRPQNLKQFDAVCFLNSVGVLWEDEELKKSLLDFVKSGKGLIGIHDAIATFVQYPKYDQWPEFGQMLGGTENGGHPWDGESMTLKIEDKTSPITAVFGGEPFVIADQAFQLQEPVFRDKLHILLSIDFEKTIAPRRMLKVREEDHDFPMAWIRDYGKGRVFFNGLGHNARVFWNEAILEFNLAGIQYALGDLEADATPSGKLK
ncbi:MAG: ThuA domain-containing protein [Verrucomicrobiae bacterium]|nr:ThuA domain-containing protein [Verrucomicrobiae bacterium]